MNMQYDPLQTGNGWQNIQKTPRNYLLKDMKSTCVQLNYQPLIDRDKHRFFQTNVHSP